MKSCKVNITNNLCSLDKLKIDTLSNEHRLLYNCLLEGAKNNLDFKDLNSLYKDFRNTNKLTINSKSSQNTCRNLINNIKSFYVLRKKDKTSKFPYRFKSYKYFCTFLYDWNNGMGGFKIKDNFLIIQGFLKIKLPLYSQVVNESNVKTLSFSKEDNKYYIAFTYSEQPSNINLNKNNFLSIDLGLSQISTCFSNVIPNFSLENNRYKPLEKRKEYVQSLRDSYKKGSKKYKRFNILYKKISKKIVNKNKDFQHKASRETINICVENNIGTLIVGDIQTKKLTKKKGEKSLTKQEKGLNKSTQGRGTLSRFKTFLEYKSKDAGLECLLVNEAYTSKENCFTGERNLSSNLSVREVEVKEGLIIDRDLNSAINIAKRVKKIGLDWFNHLEDLLNFHKMYIDTSSNLCMKII